MADDRFGYSQYLVQKKFFKLLGGEFRIFDPNGNLVLFSQMKAFKLREDIRIFTDESMSTEVLAIHARQIFDISATYDVIESSTNTIIGSLRRKGMKSILRDEWVILDTNEREIGTIKEDNVLLALIRRFLTNLVPQAYHAEINGAEVCEYKQNFNPFTLKLQVNFNSNNGHLLDHRLGLAAAILLCAIEGRQN